jgi:hypothetical protein
MNSTVVRTQIRSQRTQENFYIRVIFKMPGQIYSMSTWYVDDSTVGKSDDDDDDDAAQRILTLF